MHVRVDIFRKRIGLCFKHEQIAQIGDQIRHEPHHVFSSITLRMQQFDRFRCCASKNASRKVDHRLFAGKSENVEHIALRDFVPAKRDQLIEHRFGISQAAFCAARNRVRCRRFERDLFFSGDELQVLRDQICWDPVKIESLTPTKDGRQNLLRLSRSENEFHVLRRLLQRF